MANGTVAQGTMARRMQSEQTEGRRGAVQVRMPAWRAALHPPPLSLRAVLGVPAQMLAQVLVRCASDVAAPMYCQNQGSLPT